MFLNKRKIPCINWVKEETTIVSINEYNDILKSLINNKEIREIAPQNIGKMVRFGDTYQIIRSESYLELRVFYDAIKKYRVSLTGVKASTKNAGWEGYQYINTEFKEIYKKALMNAFSGYEYKEQYTAIKKCVITQVDYCSKIRMGKIVDHCFKSDVSSAYPTQMTKSLPTLHGFKQLKGRVEPTEEYPFAFYLKSHHVKIYNELYTADFKNSRFYTAYRDPTTKWYADDSIKPEDDETILCKKSEYSMKSIFEEIYNMRHEHPELKTYMVACIGFFHRNNNPVMSPVAAVVLARCAHDMLKRCEILENEGNEIILINTDSIIWRGKQSSISDTEKHLGSFSIEYEDTRVAVSSVKAYQIENKDGTALTRHSGLDKNISRKLKFGEIFDYKGYESHEDYFVDDSGFIIEL